METTMDDDDAECLHRNAILRFRHNVHGPVYSNHCPDCGMNVGLSEIDSPFPCPDCELYECDCADSIVPDCG